MGNGPGKKLSNSAKWGLGASIAGIGGVLAKMSIDAIREIKAKKDAKKAKIKAANPNLTKKEVRKSLRNYEMKAGGSVTKWTKSSLKHK